MLFSAYIKKYMILNNFLISIRFGCFICSSHLSFPSLNRRFHFLQLGIVSLPLLWPLPSCAMLKLRVLSFYPVPFSSWTLGKRSKRRPVCASALPYPPCKYGNSIDNIPLVTELQFILEYFFFQCSWNFSFFPVMAPLLPETLIASVSSDSVVPETLEVDSCGCVGFALLHSDLSLSTSFPS